MGKCYCDYCDVFLTNDSVAVRKQHNEGNRHKYNVCEYYRQYIGEQLQKQIDDIVASFELRVAQGLITPTYALPTTQKNSSTHGQPRSSPTDSTTDDIGEKTDATNGDEPKNNTSKQVASMDAAKGTSGAEDAAGVVRTSHDHVADGTFSQKVETKPAVNT